ncbi:MAG: YchF/TatD family DNA exonuclease [Deltaproteobacteria bacterium]|jgi:TatD DNase family protein|nr:YchF/TatD family DNA exonuclease [Deltaproteobacteria bacterium]
MIDSHCHLEMPEFDSDLKDVFVRMSEHGVTHAVSIGSLAQNERIEKTIEIAGLHDNIYTTLGVHPKSPYNDLENISELFEKYYSKNKKKIVAVGEIGLDYFLPDIPKENFEIIKTKQKELFKFQLGLASANMLPVIIHIRDAYEDAIDILKDYVKNPDGFYGGVIHCYSSAERGISDEFLKMGFFISFSGNITFKKNDGLRAAAKVIPDEKLLIETDSPYLAPQSFRGKRNEPSYVRFVLGTIAEEKGIERKKLDDLTVQNTVNLFSLEGVGGFYPAVAYKIRNSVYINLTNKCTNRCTFCPKYQGGKSNFCVQGYNLELKKEPDANEVISSVFRYYNFKEVVFCGLGEPTLRIETLKDVAKSVKNIATGIKIRLDTDGLANAVYGRNIAAELEGLIDSVSISLNAQNGGLYNALCAPQITGKGKDAYTSVLEFVKESKKHIKNVAVSAIDLPGVDIAYIENISKNLGVDFKLRHYNDVG